MTTTPTDKLVAMLAATFRTLSGSSDRDLAREAVRIEPDVLAFVKSKAKPAARRKVQKNLNLNHA